MQWVKLPARVVIIVVKAYQYVISPIFPPSCRYYPTCSAYTIQAVQKYGMVRGCLLGLRRILRCHPFAKGGYDPVQ